MGSGKQVNLLMWLDVTEPLHQRHQFPPFQDQGVHHMRWWSNSHAEITDLRMALFNMLSISVFCVFQDLLVACCEMLAFQILDASMAFNRSSDSFFLAEFSSEAAF